MAPTEILDFLSDTKTPGGFLLTVAIILALISGLFSKAAADYGGIFGKAARAIRQHKEEAIAADEASDARRLDRMEKTIQRLDREVAELRTKESRHHEYQLWVAGLWRGLEFWAVDKGLTLPPPPFMSYPEWVKQKYPETTQN
ncbi:hypothetical protein [Corynebacterium striatum]|uniref:hypothetical protein n=1 Tax=Corynebacterium striatum TaxID=43770 RepID=UPI003B5BDDE6